MSDKFIFHLVLFPACSAQISLALHYRFLGAASGCLFLHLLSFHFHISVWLLTVGIWGIRSRVFLV